MPERSSHPPRSARIDPIRQLFTVRSAQQRWPIALRAAIATSIPVMIGWWAGDPGAGLIAAIGAFTTRFGGGRPYLNRGAQLATIAVCLAAAVWLGAWAAQVWWLGVLAVSVVAVAAVLLCNALAVGPPGAYLFVVACAAGIGVSGAHLSPGRIGLLVLGGGAISWVVNMAGALAGYRRPEKTAVAAAADAVADFIEAAGTPGEGAARHRAATALHHAWRVLVNYQPLSPRPSSRLNRLRAVNHALHVLFADAMAKSADNKQIPATTVGQVRALGALDVPPEVVARREVDRIPLRRPPMTTLLRQAIRRGSHTRDVMVRVAIAAPLAGTATGTLGFGRAYWAMAAAVLVLHQGFDWLRTLQRGVERLIGTWVGLGLAAVILVVHPQGLWLAAVLALLNFTIELLVVRNYALAAVFITATALTIASGARRVDVGELLIDRGVDTAIGCAVGLAVYLTIARYQEATRLTEAIASTLEAVAVASTFLATRDLLSLAARSARRDLQIRTLAMLEAQDAAVSGSAQQRKSAEQLWPAVVAAEHLAYRTIAACWAMEHTDHQAPEGISFGTGGAELYTSLLREMAAAVRRGTPPPALDTLPPFVAAEVVTLRQSLTSAP
jgi:hypothetical protein